MKYPSLFSALKKERKKEKARMRWGSECDTEEEDG
jgi:hypothetical protein